MADNVILQGDYGRLTSTALGTESVGGTNKRVSKGWVQITAKAGTSAFTNLSVGDLYYDDRADNARLAVTDDDDKWKPITETTLNMVKSWQLEFTRNQIDTTVLKDPVSTSVYGRPNVTGTITGLLIAGDSGLTTAMSRFFETKSISSSGSVTKTDIDTDPISFLGYTLHSDAKKDYMEAYYLPSIDLGSITIGAEVGGLTEFSSPITVGYDSLNRGIKRYLVDIS